MSWGQTLYVWSLCTRCLTAALFRYANFSIDSLVPSWPILSNEFLPVLNFQQPHKWLTWPSQKLKHPNSLLPVIVENNAVAKDYLDLASFLRELPNQGQESEYNQNPLAFFTPLEVIQRSHMKAELSIYYILNFLSTLYWTFYLLSKTIALHNSRAESGLSHINIWMRNQKDWHKLPLESSG